MSWVIGNRRIANTYLLDVDEINDVFLPFTNELTALNEHNWTDGAFEAIVVNSLAEPDFAIQAHQIIHEREWESPGTTGISVPQATRWSAIPGTTQTFNSSGGKALIIYSFQLGTGTYLQDQSGLNFCIEVDGTPMLDGLLGTGDVQNDRIDKGIGAIFSGSGSAITGTYGSSPSFKSRAMPLRVQVLANLSPGRHTVRLLARNLFTDDSAYQFICNCEGIVLDMWA